MPPVTGGKTCQIKFPINHINRAASSEFGTYRLCECVCVCVCVYSGLTSLSTIFRSYHDGVWLRQGAQCSLLKCCLTEVPDALAHSEASLLGMQAAPSSIPTSSTFFRGDLVMKTFLRPFSLFR